MALVTDSNPNRLGNLLQPPVQPPLGSLLLMIPAPPPPPRPALCDIPSGCVFCTGPRTVTRSSLRVLHRVTAF